ncbi:unnamed protein product, partial [Ectocarpus sp. 13 AM-2016]
AGQHAAVRAPSVLRRQIQKEYLRAWHCTALHCRSWPLLHRRDLQQYLKALLLCYPTPGGDMRRQMQFVLGKGTVAASACLALAYACLSARRATAFGLGLRPTP